MPELKLTVLSLRYSSWSMRPWLALTHAGAEFDCETAQLESFETTPLAERRELGSVTGLFPVLRVDGHPIHESLAICEYAAEAWPEAKLWPEDLIERSTARAYCAEMASGFSAMRNEMSCHLFARAPALVPSDAAQKNIDRIFEIWSGCLARSGGPFLFSEPTIADFFYYPVLTRFRTYGIEIPVALEPYTNAVDTLPVVARLIEAAAGAPRTAVYDDYIRSLGGDPDAALNMDRMER